MNSATSANPCVHYEMSLEQPPSGLTTITVALCFWRALRASVLYGTEARKAQKIIGDTVTSISLGTGMVLLHFKLKVVQNYCYILLLYATEVLRYFSSNF